MGGRIRLLDYSRVLAFLRQSHDATEVAEHIGFKLDGVRMLLRRLNAARLIHVCDWTDARPHCAPRPIYLLGDRPDAPAPLTWRGRPSRRREVVGPSPTPRSNLVAFVQLIRALQADKHTRLELAEESGLNADYVSDAIKYLHAQRMVHVAGWEQSRTGYAAACWSWGKRADVPRPAPIERQEIARRYQRDRRQKLRMVRINQALAGNAEVFHQRA